MVIKQHFHHAVAQIQTRWEFPDFWNQLGKRLVWSVWFGFKFCEPGPTHMTTFDWKHLECSNFILSPTVDPFVQGVKLCRMPLNYPLKVSKELLRVRDPVVCSRIGAFAHAMMHASSGINCFSLLRTASHLLLHNRRIWESQDMYHESSEPLLLIAGQRQHFELWPHINQPVWSTTSTHGTVLQCVWWCYGVPTHSVLYTTTTLGQCSMTCMIPDFRLSSNSVLCCSAASKFQGVSATPVAECCLMLLNVA